MNIYYYYIRICKATGVHSVTLNELDIVLENRNEYVVENTNLQRFHLLSKEGDTRHSKLDNPEVYETKFGITSLDGVVFTAYTTHKLEPKTIKRAIKKFLDKEYKGYSISLDFIDTTLCLNEND